jgi:amino acid adenylation domain-containing protein
MTLLESKATTRSSKDLPRLTDSERELVLHRFNETTVSYPHDALIHEIFSVQAQRAPDAVAVRSVDRYLTYAQMNRQANRIAHALQAHGVRPDDRVALCAERGIDLIVGALAILKSGGAYVPLDPHYPTERLSFMLADSAPIVVLGSKTFLGSPAISGHPAVALDEDIAQTQSESDPVVPGLTSRNLAYVIYTSGSTGQPKGVMIEHRSVLRLVTNTTPVQIGPADCVVHCASPSFDATTWELWAPLLHGAQVLVIPQCVLMNPTALNQVLVQHAATAMFLTVALFHEYVDALEPAFGQLRCLLAGGDSLNPVAAARLMSKAVRPDHFFNAYGPTETTTFATMFEVTSEAMDGRSVPIGRPIANTCVYILDPNLAPVPVGQSGEVYIGGPGVARGYLNRPELTAERFIADPFCTGTGARLYRSGDLGRWRDDGNIEFLGRDDLQVKIRGYRIELGEIEAHLASTPGVRDVAVLAREDTAGVRRLVAYLTAEAEATISPASLRTHAADRLPDYMIPSAYVVLDRLPLTANGKVDRQALPEPDAAALVTREYERPQGKHEVMLARLWQEILGVSHVGRQDDFFELGGDSMQAMKLIDRLAEIFRVEFPFAAVFQYPTFAEMIDHISNLTSAEHSMSNGQQGGQTT